MMGQVTPGHLLSGMVGFLLFATTARFIRYAKRNDSNVRDLAHSKVLAAVAVSMAIRLYVELQEGLPTPWLPHMLIAAALLAPLAMREQIWRFRRVPSPSDTAKTRKEPRLTASQSLVVAAYLLPWLLLAGCALWVLVSSPTISRLGSTVTAAFLAIVVVLLIYASRKEWSGKH